MVKQIRQQLGLSQQALADYLGVSRSHLAMVESKRRDLHPEKNVVLLSLLTRHTPKSNLKNAAISKDISKVTAQNASAFIADSLLMKEYSLKVLQRKLKKLRDQNKRAVETLSGMQSVKQSSSSKEKFLFDAVESSALQAYSGSAADVQLKLEMQIEGITAEIRFLKSKKAKPVL